MKISDAFKEFLDYSLLERCLEPTTVNWYKQNIKAFYNYLRYKVVPPTIDVLTTENLRSYFMGYRQRGISPRSILNQMQSLKAFCTFLVKRGYLDKNLFDGIERPTLKRKLQEFLNEEEARQLLQACISMKRGHNSKRYKDMLECV